jgi:hypothetical protein
MSKRVALFIDGYAVGAAVALVIGTVVSDEVVYRFFVVPRLGEQQFVPASVWLVAVSPIILMGLLGGAFLTRWLHVVSGAVLSAIAVQGYGHAAAVLHSPGWGKSLALEAPLEFWTIGVLLVAVAFGVLLLLGRAVRWVVSSVVRAQPMGARSRAGA